MICLYSSELLDSPYKNKNFKYLKFGLRLLVRFFILFKYDPFIKIWPILSARFHGYNYSQHRQCCARELWNTRSPLVQNKQTNQEGNGGNPNSISLTWCHKHVFRFLCLHEHICELWLLSQNKWNSSPSLFLEIKIYKMKFFHYSQRHVISSIYLLHRNLHYLKQKKKKYSHPWSIYNMVGFSIYVLLGIILK